MQKNSYKILTSIILLLVTGSGIASEANIKSSSEKSKSASSKKVANIQIGDFVGGGTVFYVNTKTREGLIAAPTDSDEDVGDDFVGYYTWGKPDTIGIEAQGAVLFSGGLNTNVILSQPENSAYKAILAATTYDISLKEDNIIEGVECSGWYLPSVYELMLMFMFGAPDIPNPNQPVLKSNVLIRNFEATKYWSSTEYIPPFTDCAWVVNFENGSLSGELKDSVFTKYKVRAVRSFVY